MRIIKGISIILLHLALGILVSRLSNGFLPGSVAGMILLFISLALGLVKEDSVRETANFLTGNMVIFFLPAMVGIMEVWGLVRLNFWGWICVLVLTTAIVMITSGLVQELVERIKGKEEKK